MKHIHKRVASIFLSLILFCSLVTPAFAAKSYDANAALTYAKNHWNDGNGLCAEFVSNCLKAGGCTNVWSRGCTTMVGQLKKSGYGTWHQLTLENDGRISVPKNNNKLSVGDPVFYYCPKETDGCPYVHVVLYSGKDSNGYLKAYAHNRARNNEVIQYAYCGYCGAKISAAYVYHMNSSTSESSPQYFNCNVKIDCISGKTVNLYNNPGDSTRVDYFSKGQSMTSSYGAKLSDGTTWYRITVDSNGAARNVWLKYESSKMTVKDLNSSTPASIKPSTSSLTLDLSKNSSQAITLTLAGSQIDGCEIHAEISNPNVASNTWDNYAGGTTIRAVITGKSVGTTRITYSIVNKDTQKTLATNSIQVTVTAPSYTIKYDANGGSGAPATQTKTYQKAITLSSNQPTRAGYTFSGWAISSNGSVQYQPGGQYTANQNTTLYAVWAANSYTVRYDANGGSGAPAVQTKIHQKVLTLSSGKPTREGYTFAGWATSTNGSVQYQPGSQYTANQNVTLYAVWSTNSYTVRYDANGGSGAPAAQTKTHQKALTLSSGQPVRSGYAFSGWATSSNGSVQYQPGDQYTVNQNATLYAVWSALNDVTLTLDKNSFNVDEGEPIALSFSYTGNIDKVTYNIGNESICRFDYTESTSNQNGKKFISMIFKAWSVGTTSIAINLLNENGDIVATKSASVTVNAAQVAPTLVAYRYNGSTLSLKVGESAKIKVTAVYSDGTTKDVTSSCGLYSTNTEVVSVSGGTITAIKEGNAQISIRTVPSGIQTPSPIAVEVEENEPSIISYRYNASSRSVEVGGAGATVKVYAVYSDGSSKDVTSSCDLYLTDSSIAKLERGAVFGLKVGTTYISIRNVPSGIVAPDPIEVTVIDPVVAPKSIALWDYLINENATGATIEMCEGENSRTFKAVFDSATTQEQQVIWESSDESVVDVSSPNRTVTYIEAKRPGTATLTVRTSDGKLSASCTIIVNPLEISISPANIKLKAGQSVQITINVFGTSFGSVKCSTADAGVATVKSNYVTVDGKQVFTVTAVNPGTTTLTASSIYSWAEGATNGGKKTITIIVE